MAESNFKPDDEVKFIVVLPARGMTEDEARHFLATGEAPKLGAAPNEGLNNPLSAALPDVTASGVNRPKATKFSPLGSSLAAENDGTHGTGTTIYQRLHGFKSAITVIKNPEFESKIRRDSDGKFAPRGSGVVKRTVVAEPATGPVSFASRIKAAKRGKQALTSVPVQAETGYGRYDGFKDTRKLQWRDNDPSWTPEEAQRHFDAVDDYRDSAYDPLNKYLRGQITEDQLMSPGERFNGERVPPNEVPHLLDELHNLSRTSDDTLVYRGTATGRGIFGSSLSGNLEGFEWKEDGYNSTSANPEIAESYFASSGGLVMRILVPQGTGAIQLSEWDLNGDPDEPDEAELLLERGLRHRVVKDNGVDENGIRRLDVEIF